MNKYANVYAWSLSSSLPEAFQHGLILAHRKFIGNEQLQITFTAALGAGVQIDVWDFGQSVFEYGSNYAKEMALYIKIILSI